MSNENDESSVIRDLRKQLKDANDQLASLQPLARELAFQKAGVDVESGPGKFFASKYDGELDADAIRAAAEEYGFVSDGQPKGPAAPEPDDPQPRMDALRQRSTPEGSGKRLSFGEWSQLSKDDPNAAQAAHAEGLVDFPSHMTPHLAAPQGAA